MFFRRKSVGERSYLQIVELLRGSWRAAGIPEIASQVIGHGGDDALALKRNHPALFDDVRRFLDNLQTPTISASETDARHGRIETRIASLPSDIAWLQKSHA